MQEKFNYTVFNLPIIKQLLSISDNVSEFLRAAIYDLYNLCVPCNSLKCIPQQELLPGIFDHN